MTQDARQHGEKGSALRKRIYELQEESNTIFWKGTKSTSPGGIVFNAKTPLDHADIEKLLAIHKEQEQVLKELRELGF